MWDIFVPWFLHYTVRTIWYLNFPLLLLTSLLKNTPTIFKFVCFWFVYPRSNDNIESFMGCTSSSRRLTLADVWVRHVCVGIWSSINPLPYRTIINVCLVMFSKMKNDTIQIWIVLQIIIHEKCTFTKYNGIYWTRNWLDHFCGLFGINFLEKIIWNAFIHIFLL